MAAHLAHQSGHQPPDHGLARADDMGVAHGPAHDPTQHIAPSFVGRQDPVGNQERSGAQMIGNDPMGHGMGAIRRAVRNVGRGLDQGAHQIDVVIVVLALQHGRHAFKPHAGIDRRLGQRDPLVGAKLLELHEDEIPDLGETVAILVRAARRATLHGRSVIVENLRTRPAGAHVAHGPEIVGTGDADDAIGGQAGDLAPQIERFIVVDIHRHRQPIGGQAEILGDQGPSMLDGNVLEIVAEREVAQHLEEGVMAPVVTDIFQIVVLAAGAHDLLRRNGPLIGPLFRAREQVLELHHAGIGEQQGRIVARHERTRRHDLVVVAGEIVQKGLANIVCAWHVCFACVLGWRHGDGLPPCAPTREERSAGVFTTGHYSCRTVTSALHHPPERAFSPAIRSLSSMPMWCRARTPVPCDTIKGPRRRKRHGPRP